MYDYKFSSFSHVKLICDSLKLAKWCVFCYQVICHNYPIREKMLFESILLCVTKFQICDESTRGKNDRERDLQLLVLGKYIKCKFCALGKVNCDR